MSMPQRSNSGGSIGMEDRRAGSWSSGQGVPLPGTGSGNQTTITAGGPGGPGVPHRHSIPLTPTLPSISDLHESPAEQAHSLPQLRSAGSAGSASRSPEDQTRGLPMAAPAQYSGSGRHQQGDGSAWFLGGTGSARSAHSSGSGGQHGAGRGSGEWGERPGTGRPDTSGSIAPDYGHPASSLYAHPHPSLEQTGPVYSNSPRGRMSLSSGLLNPMEDETEYPPFNYVHSAQPAHAAPAPPPPSFEQRLSSESAASAGAPNQGGNGSQHHGSRGLDALLEGLDAAQNGAGTNGGPSADEGAHEDDKAKAKRPKGARAGSGGKRGVDYDDGSEEYKRKRKLIDKGLVSCEACRRGKRKCEPHPLVPLDHPDIARLPCERCRRFALECVRERAPKRKGPAPTDLSAISDAMHGFAAEDGGAAGASEMHGDGRAANGGAGGNGQISREAGANGMGNAIAGPSRAAGQSQEQVPQMPQQFSQDQSHLMGSHGGEMHASGSGSGSGIGLGFGDVNGGLAPGLQHQGSGPSSAPRHFCFPERSIYLTSSGNGPSPAFPLLASSPSYTLGQIPDNLDQVVSGNVIDSIVGLFFDYVYPLTPCLHRPTFISNLTNRLDKTDPVFFALTLTVLASTLVQVPRSLVNLDKGEVENLARRCVRVARAKIAYIWEESVPVQSSFVVISYLEGIVHLLLGNNTAHVICTANANQLALTMRLNEESSYEGLDPIESEIRRRIYWLLFQADKSTACMRARSINLRLEDAAQLRLPAEVDDEQITPSGILPQPLGRTPIIAGFNIVTDLFRTLNDALILQRRRTTSTIDSLLADLQSVNELKEKVMRTAMDVATPLKLAKAMDSRMSSPAHDWEAKLQARFLDFFQAPADESHTLNSFLVLQGNILVTQHVVRLVLLQTREALLQQLAVLTQMPVQGIGRLAGMQADEPAEDIACELLDGLNSLPVECVATNGPSLVQKVRFVAIQLMECSVSPSPTTARAQKLLMQFLSVLSVIEGMYTFGKDISAD